MLYVVYVCATVNIKLRHFLLFYASLPELLPEQFPCKQQCHWNKWCSVPDEMRTFSQTHVCSFTGIPSFAVSHAPSLLVFPHSPKSPVFGPKRESLSQQCGHDPSVNSFVDNDLLYWCDVQAVSPQRAINSPELTLKSTQTTAVGKHSALWRTSALGQVHH